MIKSSLPTFTIKTEPHFEDESEFQTALAVQRQRKLLENVSRAEKMLDILDFTLNASDYDLRHSWCYWEDYDRGEKEKLYWPGCFSPGKTAYIAQQKGPDQTKWPGWLVTWCKR